MSRRFVLFTMLVALNLFDVYVTRLGIVHGVLAEANPLMQRAVEDFWFATGVKLAVLALVALMLVAIRPRWRTMETVLATGIGWYVAVVGWNVGIVLGAGSG